MGGVLMNLDYNKTTEAFKNLGYVDFEKMYSMLAVNNVFDDLETGKIGEMEFYDAMLKVGNGHVSIEQINTAWNAMMLDFRETSLKQLEALGRSHQLFLLSNTNQIHKKAFDVIFRKQTGIQSLDILFKKAYYSHLVGLRKPGEEIFRFVLADAGISVEETLFIDDLIANVETARKLGFKTHLLLANEKIEDLNYKN
ncbi:HAD family phosphatase [soil metagenome]